MIHYLFSDERSGYLFNVAHTWPVWRQLVAECAQDPEPTQVCPYDDQARPVGPVVVIGGPA